MKIGDRIQVHACKADGTVYRSWYAVIESVDAHSVVTIAPAGSAVEHKPINGKYTLEHHMRSYYWFDKFYNLIEVFEVSGELMEIYVNLASPPEFVDGGMMFVDHELDILKVIPGEARIMDEDEFAEAVVKYRYSQEFKAKIYAVAKEALILAEKWNAQPCPVFVGKRGA